MFYLIMFGLSMFLIGGNVALWAKNGIKPGLLFYAVIFAAVVQFANVAEQMSGGLR